MATLGILSPAKCNNRLLFSAHFVNSTQYNDQKVRRVVYSAQFVILKREIGEALITIKALLLYRPWENYGLSESIFHPIVQACGFFRLVVTFGS